MTPETENAIINRLDATGLFRRVQSVADVSAQSISTQITPAAYVAYSGYAVDETNASRQSARLTERWTIYIVTKNARQSDHQQGRQEALTLASAAFRAIMGHIPTGSHKPFEPVSPSERPVWDSGFTWIPLAFTHLTVMKAS